MVKIEPSLFLHVEDEGGQQQRSGLADSPGHRPHWLPQEQRTLSATWAPSFLLGSPAASSLAQALHQLCNRVPLSQAVLFLKGWQVSKLEGRVMVSSFQQKKLSDKGRLFCPESCPFFFPNFYPSYLNSSNSINHGKKMN